MINKKVAAVADAVRDILQQEAKELSAKQKKIAALAGDKDKIDAEDFKKLRGEELEITMTAEEFEQLDELSKKTLGAYIKKASVNNMAQGIKFGSHAEKGETDDAIKVGNKFSKRSGNIGKATDRLTKEEDSTQSAMSMFSRIMEKVAERELDEAFPTVADARKKANAPQPSGGAGIKQGTRYGGGRQAPDVEPEDDDEKKPFTRMSGAHKNRRTDTKLYKEEEVDEAAGKLAEEGVVKDIKRLVTGKDAKSRAGQEIAKSQDANMKGDYKTSKKHFDRFDKLDKLTQKEEFESVDEAKDEYDKMFDKLMKKSGDRLTKKYSNDVKKTKDNNSGKSLDKHIKKNPNVIKTYSNDVQRTKKMYGEEVDESAFDPLKHVKNPTPGEKTAAKDVKRGSYADRAAMLKSAEAGGRLKEDGNPPWDGPSTKTKGDVKDKSGAVHTAASRAKDSAQKGMKTFAQKRKELEESLSKKAPPADWIHDFVHSDNPKFAGKSTKERQKMALAAYYAKQRNEEVDMDEAFDTTNPQSYSVTVHHKTKDGETGKAEYKINKANSGTHAKHIAMQRHEKALSASGIKVSSMHTDSQNVKPLGEGRGPTSQVDEPFVTDDSKPLQNAKDLAKSTMKRIKTEMMGKTGTSE